MSREAVEAVEGDTYLIDVLARGRGVSSGAEVEQQVWHVLRLDGIRASHHWSVWDHEAAVQLLQERKTERPG